QKCRRPRRSATKKWSPLNSADLRLAAEDYPGRETQSFSQRARDDEGHVRISPLLIASVDAVAIRAKGVTVVHQLTDLVLFCNLPDPVIVVDLTCKGVQCVSDDQDPPRRQLLRLLQTLDFPLGEIELRRGFQVVRDDRRMRIRRDPDLV